MSFKKIRKYRRRLSDCGVGLLLFASTKLDAINLKTAIHFIRLDLNSG